MKKGGNRPIIIVGVLVIAFLFIAYSAHAFNFFGLFSALTLGPVVAPTTASPQGTLSSSMESYLTAMRQSVTVANVNGQPTLLVHAWNHGYGSNCPTDSSTDFCLITDESSQYLLALSMSRDTNLLSVQAPAAFNYLKAVAKTQNDGNGNQPYGITASWVARAQISGSTATVSGWSKDFASDADARNIIALWNFVNNPSVTDTGLKSQMRTYAATYCADYKKYSFNSYSMKDPIDGRTINTWFGSGGNVARGVFNGQFAYGGYFGDGALAMMACGMQLNDPSYFTYADNTLEEFLIMAKWTPTTGLKVPACRDGGWSKDGNGYAVYTGTDACPNPAGTDDADAVRFVSVCTALHYAEANGITINSHISKYCNDFKSSASYTSTTYSRQIYSDGTPKESGQKGNFYAGLGLYIDLGINHDAATQRAVNMVSPINSNGLYWNGLQAVPLGYALGRADATFSTGLSYTPGEGVGPVCPSGGTYPSCTCPTGQNYQVGTNSCVTDAVNNTVVTLCPTGATGTYPSCVCSAGQTYTLSTNTCALADVTQQQSASQTVNTGGGSSPVVPVQQMTNTTELPTTVPVSVDNTGLYLVGFLAIIIILTKKGGRK